MSNKCPNCGRKDIHITYYPAPTDNMATCYGCGYTDLLEKFPEQSVFDCITASPEVLAEKFIFSRGEKYWRRRRCETVCCEVWWSALTGEEYKSRDEAYGATVARLKEAAE